MRLHSTATPLPRERFHKPLDRGEENLGSRPKGQGSRIWIDGCGVVERSGVRVRQNVGACIARMISKHVKRSKDIGGVCT